MNLKGMINLSKQISICEGCSLSRFTTPVTPRWIGNPKIMFIGECPGKEEEKQGKPFVGKAGYYLNEVIKYLSVDYIITNTVKCRCSENNIGKKNRRPTSTEISSCYCWLEKEILLVKPKIIVLLGNTSLQNFFPGERISEYHGNVIECQNNILYFVLYHPAMLVYNLNNYDKYFSGVNNLKTLLREVI